MDEGYKTLFEWDVDEEDVDVARYIELAGFEKSIEEKLIKAEETGEPWFVQHMIGSSADVENLKKGIESAEGEEIRLDMDMLALLMFMGMSGADARIITKIMRFVRLTLRNCFTSLRMRFLRKDSKILRLSVNI